MEVSHRSHESAAGDGEEELTNEEKEKAEQAFHAFAKKSKDWIDADDLRAALQSRRQSQTIA